MIEINSYKLTPAITATWGSISGVIDDQADLMSLLGSYATESWVSSQQFATESWVSEQGYLYSNNTSGDKTMNFNTDIPSIYLRNTVSRQLTINPWLISMYGSSTGALITPNTVGTLMGDVSSYKTAGAICDSDLSSAVLVVRDAEDYLKIDCHNIYTYSGGISITYPLSEFASKGDLSGYATESWVSGQGYLTNVPSEYATEQWVGQQGYAFNSDLTSLASRVTTLETNYGDAITITNNILG